MPVERRGRPRCFDAEAALEKALGVFLRLGYDATSLDDLTEAMGINRPSLYAAFGNKAALYNAALKLYAKKGMEQMLAELKAAGDPVTGLQQFIRGLAKRITSGCGECLVTASAAQCANGRAADDAKIAMVTHDVVEDIARQLSAYFDAAKKLGRLKEQTDSQALAHYVAGLAQGLTTFGRTSGNPKAVHDMAEVACAFFETLRD
jgi:AcrR family transcriptional regulator